MRAEKGDVWMVGLAVLAFGWLAAGGFTAGQSDDLKKCRAGDAAACQRLGFSPEVAKQVARYYQKPDQKIWKTQDQELLWALVKTGWSRECGNAIERITETRYLVDLAASDLPGDFEDKAAKRLQDPQDLAQVAIRLADGYQSVYMAEYVVGQIADQQLLTRLATTAASHNVRSMAVEKLEDQQVLMQIATTDKNSWVRIAATKRVQDEAFLARIALTEENKDLRMAAVQGIHDQAVLAQIMTEEKLGEIRTAAAKNITDERLLANLLLAGKVGSSAMAAVKDPALLQEIARNAEEQYTRSAAVKRIDDQPCLQSIVLNDPEDWVRSCALERITDTAFIIRVLTSWDSVHGCQTVMDRLNDPAGLKKLSVEAIDPMVRREAVLRVTDRDFLRELAPKDPQVKSGVKKRLEYLDLIDALTVSKELPAEAPNITREGERVFELIQDEGCEGHLVREMVHVERQGYRANGRMGVSLRGKIETFYPSTHFMRAVLDSTGSAIAGPTRESMSAYPVRLIVGGKRQTAIAVLEDNDHFYYQLIIVYRLPGFAGLQVEPGGCIPMGGVVERYELRFLQGPVFRFISDETGEGVEEQFTKGEGYQILQKAKAVLGPDGRWKWESLQDNP